MTVADVAKLYAATGLTLRVIGPEERSDNWHAAVLYEADGRMRRLHAAASQEQALDLLTRSSQTRGK